VRDWHGVGRETESRDRARERAGSSEGNSAGKVFGRRDNPDVFLEESFFLMDSFLEGSFLEEDGGIAFTFQKQLRYWGDNKEYNMAF